MVSLEGFNAEKIAPQAPMETLPPGDYQAIIIESEKKPTKAGNGAFIELKMQIIDGPYKGRHQWDRLNLWNPSEQAVAIAQATLSAICHAVGVMQPRDTSQLHNKPLLVSVGTRKDDKQELVNTVKGYKPRNGSSPAVPAVAAQTKQDLEDKAPWA